MWTWDGSDSTVYVNNILKATRSDLSGDLGINAAQDIGIGKRLPCSNLPYDGDIDEIQISTARSSAWVGASYYSQTLELVYEGYHTGVEYARKGEILAAALVASLILIPLLTLVIFAARRKH